MNTRTSKVRRRARLAMTVLAGALVLPGLAAADHFDCEPGSTSNPCGKFDPQLNAGAQVPYTDTPSSITFRYNQKAEGTHDQPVVGVQYLAPIGWQFAVSTLRPSQVSEGGHPDPVGTSPASSCAEVIVGEQNDSNGSAATLGRAENLAGGVGLQAENDSNGVLNFGYGNPRRPSLSFLGYDAVSDTVSMCLYLYANQFVGVPAQGPNGLLAPAQPQEDAREHIIPVTMTRVQPGELLDGEDISLKFSWKIEFDVTSVLAHEWLRGDNVRILESLFYIDAISGGNWNINEVTGDREQIVFSKTPKSAGEYEFRGIFSTCAEGFNTTTSSTTEGAEALDPEDVCNNGNLLTASSSVFQKILHPPNANVLDFGRLTGPAGDISVNRFGLIRGTNEVTFTWTQPDVPVEETIKGYVLAIAEPGDQDSRHFEYMITNPADGGFDVREPCGPAGDEASCSLTVSFPLSTVGPNFLGLNGKYDVALVTLYEGTNGASDKRSDGLCDDGTGFGTDCPLTDPAFRIDVHRSFDMNRVPGISTWQFMLREKAWPVAYVQTANVSRSGGGPSFTAPKNVLLVDFDLRQAEFTVWNALGFEERFFAASNAIIGDNAGGGIVSFGSSSMTGHSVNWRFDGRILPAGQALPSSVNLFITQVPVPDQAQLAIRAYGSFISYDLKGLPGAIPPGGLPAGIQIPFASNTPI